MGMRLITLENYFKNFRKILKNTIKFIDFKNEEMKNLSFIQTHTHTHTHTHTKLRRGRNEVC